MVLQLKVFLVLAAIGCFQQKAFSQSQASFENPVGEMPDKLLRRISGHASGIQDRINWQTEKYLHRMCREEKKLKSRLTKNDSIAAEQIFGDVETQYTRWQEMISKTSSKSTGIARKYIPRLDTLQTALKCLGNMNGSLQNTPEIEGKLKDAISEIDLLQSKFSQAEDLTNYIRSRRQFLEDRLARYGMIKDLQRFKKQAYYYRSQVEEYKKLMNDPSLLEAKALQVLKQTSLFKDFFNKHSELAGMFNLPGNSSLSTDASFTSLQTREAVQQVMAQRFGTGMEMQQTVREQVQAGQLELGQLKQLEDKIRRSGGSGADMDMPGFKPNHQKVKRLKNRLELGTNLQTVKSNRFFPSTSDIGVSLGYKLNDNSTIGVGGSYKMGWGKDIRHITLSHQGVGVRSFVDYKIKGSFWLSGGGELNYRSQFNRFEILDDYSPWQKSALLGVSKRYRVSNNLKGNAQLMYDFLWKDQIPRTQPLVFRVGYSLK